MTRIPTESKTKKSQFDPTKSYKWEPNDEFVIKGSELDYFNKLVNIELSTPEATRVQNLLQARALLLNIFKEAFDDGILREVEEKETKASTEEVEELASEEVK